MVALALTARLRRLPAHLTKASSLQVLSVPRKSPGLLKKLTNMVSLLVDKVNHLTGKVAILRGHIGNMCHDYNSSTEDPDSPEELMSEAGLEGWHASCAELQDLKGVNSEALWRVMQWRLDEDMAQLQAQGMPETEKLNASDLYEISNCKFWYGLRGPEMMAEMKVKRDYFQATCNKFYKLGGHWSEWQIWKATFRRIIVRSLWWRIWIQWRR